MLAGEEKSDVRSSQNGKVLFLLNSLTVGGSEKKIIRIVNALIQRGQGIHVAYINGPDSLLNVIDKNVSVIGLRRRGRFSVFGLGRLIIYVFRCGIERIIAVNLHPLLYAFLTSRLLLSKPAVIALVNTSIHRSRRSQRFMRLYAPLLRRADRVIFGSQHQLLNWVRDYDLNAQRCLCILNGVDTEHFAPNVQLSVRNAWRERLGIRPGDLVVGTVGMMRPEKGHKDLLAAAGALRRAGIPLAVLLVGDGPCRAELERYAEQTGVSDVVRFYGQAQDVRPLLNVMDVFVLSSVAVETFSNAALEAMAAGKAVILSDLGGAREMIVPGESGMMYESGNVEALIQALHTLCRDREIRERLGSMARKRVIEEFSFDRMLDDYQRWVLAFSAQAPASWRQ